MDGVSESLELCDEPSGVGFVVAAGEPVRAEIAVGLVLAEHVEGRDEDGVRNGDLGSPGTATFGEPCVLRGEVVLAMHPTHRARGFNQHRGQPLVPVPLARRGAFAGRLIDPGRDTGPGRELGRRPEPGHVRAGLGDDDLGDLLPDPGEKVCSNSI